MNKLNKTILLLTIPLLLELIVSCCDCLDTTFLNYSNCSLEISNLDNSGPAPQIAQAKSVSGNAYGIRISISRSEKLCEFKGGNSLFISSAYATSCRCPPEIQYLPSDSIVSVLITTINNFDAERPAGSDVSDLFYVFKRNGFSEINAFIESLDPVLNDFMTSPLEFDLLLMSSPTLNKEHEFEISIKLSDNRMLTAKTGIIILH